MALINGTAGAETLAGTAANDTVIGKAGNDTASMGAGNDLFVWNPGDGNDVVEGQAGFDTLRFNGSADSELISITAAAGGRISLTRDVNSVAMDLNDVERINVGTAGGSDLVFVNDLTGTDGKLVVIDLAGVPGGATGDGNSDTVFVAGSGGNNSINVGLAGKAVSVTGLPAQVLLARAEAADFLAVTGEGGDDKINASKLAPGVIQFFAFAGNGNDTVTGSAGADNLSGESGNDSLLGNSGTDTLGGDEGNDTLIGGKGDDQNFGDAGDDVFIYNSGHGTDLVEGGDGTDLLNINGGAGAEIFTATANGTRVRFDRLSPAPFAIDIGTTESLVLKAGAGNDKFFATGNLAALIAITVDGGAGNDTLLGGNGIDSLLGGEGNDSIDGNQGNDSAFLGKGNDAFQWDPGDGSDKVEGQGGFDKLIFNGSAGAEIFTLSADGSRARLTRDLGNIVMDLDDVERIEINAFGGADKVAVFDMTGTDVKQVAVNLAVLGAGDGATDLVIVNGTNNSNSINVGLVGKNIAVTGLAAVTTIAGAEASDGLTVNGLGGDDKIGASKLSAGLITLTLDAGSGNDTVAGSLGADVLLGGDGNDLVVGDDGNDVAFLGAANDLFVWNNGDGSDVVEGQGDIDTLRFTGSGVAEIISISANGGRALLISRR